MNTENQGRSQAQSLQKATLREFDRRDPRRLPEVPASAGDFCGITIWDHARSIEELLNEVYHDVAHCTARLRSTWEHLQERQALLAQAENINDATDRRRWCVDRSNEVCWIAREYHVQTRQIARVFRSLIAPSLSDAIADLSDATAAYAISVADDEPAQGDHLAEIDDLVGRITAGLDAVESAVRYVG